MKAAPVVAALGRITGIGQILVHTGQHYDKAMSDVFFQQLGIPEPDFNLEVGSGSHARQTAEVMIRFEEVLLNKQCDLLLVYGDVNSTIASAMVAKKLGIKVGHVEAGLRSRDRSMPEEINRILTDRISDLLFTPSADGDDNLKTEGLHDSQHVIRVGNVMIDTLVRLLPRAVQPDIDSLEERFVLVTLHRPSNVDDAQQLRRLVDALNRISEGTQVIFPVHPRTRQKLSELDTGPLNKKLRLVDPLGYLQFLWMQQRAAVVVTDSGGIQEETTYLQVPCLTMRENTERPVTVEIGTNELIGKDTDRLLEKVGMILTGNAKQGKVPELWDGKASVRIAEAVAAKFALS
jgi:UDP-N-acetylglucosamine 2-epimerase (non-hydrolysing)